MSERTSYDTGRDGSSMKPPMFRRKGVWMIAVGLFVIGGALAVVFSIGIVGAGGGGGGSSLSFGASSGAVNPKPQLPPAEVKTNRNELGSVLVSAYDKLGLPWNTFSDPESAQSKALTWVAGSGTYPGMDRAERVQRYALAVFYYSTFQKSHNFSQQPTGWSSSTRWLSQESECTWEGILCTNGKVSSILLAEHFLSGSLPMEMALLRDNLTTLDLSRNNILMQGDELEVFGYLYKLENLIFDDNYMVTTDGLPESFSELAALEKLTLSYNLLQGEIDGAIISNMQALTHLEIESNYLTGSLPMQLGQLQNLVYLYARRNDFVMQLDDLMAPGNLQSIFALWLDSNSINGRIPTSIGLLKDLASLSITNSTLQGPLPTEMAQLTKLQRLWLYDNNLSGPIPQELAALTNLEVVELYQNQLTGVMPTVICQVIKASDYDFKIISADCDEVQCGNCCTCY